MVFYECVVATKNHTEFWRLTELVKRLSHEVVSSGGIVRGIHNHGIREVPHRFKSKYADQVGRRYYEKVRFFSVYFDCNPSTRTVAERILATDEHVLRQTHLRARSMLDAVNEATVKKNPWLQMVKQEQEESGEGNGQKEEDEEEIVSFF
mmetsp:Transcript_6020/g.7804  ORF Transcript_6020/g.7804 Transcript_6020/m.7804 type:complete len:150 (-) Transcript_6020:204-653(-)|eukprot:CAMPEP_0198143962 /NCGR_PEP_ID=MMETSP1443-20131203/12126_1 /TAXON_ID=186043 /ORGANISM="Entomoneis sp., Strain CCMP2396" /LENGTH=149 /DNA_ID=CAMNT_0043807273 /DNA_START=143 /DNA_END=592 /DNA_ORIENTATION=+